MPVSTASLAETLNELEDYKARNEESQRMLAESQRMPAESERMLAESQRMLDEHRSREERMKDKVYDCIYLIFICVIEYLFIKCCFRDKETSYTSTVVLHKAWL